MQIIGLNNKINQFNTLKKATEENTTNLSNTQISSYIKPDLKHLQANFVSFKGADKPNILNTDNISHVISALDIESANLWEAAVKKAKETGSAEVNSLHFIAVAAEGALNSFANRKPESTAILKIAQSLNEDILSSENKLLALEMEIEELIMEVYHSIEQLPKSKNGPKTVSKEFQEILDNAYKFDSKHWDGLNDTTIKAKTILIHTTINNADDVTVRKQKEFHDFLANVGKITEGSWENNSISKVNETLNRNKPGSVPTNNSSSNLPALRESDTKVFNKIFSEDTVELNTLATNRVLFDFDNYKQKAKVVGNLVSAGRHANMLYNKGSRPEFIAHCFTNMVKNGEFKDLDLNNTDVHYWDMNKIVNGNNLQKPFNDLAKYMTQSKADGKHRVLFIKDFHHFITMQKPDIKGYFTSGKFGDKVHIIGLMNKEIYDELTAPVNGKKQVMALEWENAMEKVSVSAPSPKQAKEMLLSDHRLIHQITSGHSENLIIEEGAITKAVDIAAVSRTGELPGKALDLLDLVIAAKHNKEVNVERITSEDVMTYLNVYPELKQSPTSGGGQFTLIPDTGITLKDVGGADQAKDVVQEVLDFIKTPEKFAITGASTPKGVLLSGTPGNGKTHMAKAIAGEAGVPFISVSGSQFVEKYVGVGASRVRELFDFARQQAQALAEPGKKGTAIIFIDEFDALGRKRGGDSGGGGREAEQTLNQLLVEMDGLKPDDNTNIIVLGATNRPDLLDDALTERPGRFDHKIDVPNPAGDPQARYEILCVHARHKKFAGDKEAILRELADRTSGSSGARLADILNKASIIAAKDGRAELGIDDLIEAKLESLAGRINKADNKPAWYKELVVAHECGHALCLQVMNNIAKHNWNLHHEIDTITTDSRGSYGGAVYPKPNPENPNTFTFERVFTDLVFGYGGYAVEKTSHFKMNGSSGISSDLKQSKERAVTAVTKWGMGAKTGLDIPLDNNLTPENREDIKLLIKQAARASQLIVKFHNQFLKEYVAEYKKDAGNGGNNLSGEEFIKRLNKWYDAKAGRREAFNKLAAEIQDIMSSTQNGKTNIKRTTK